MSDDKPKPVDDLKEGLGLLFRAAKSAVEKLPTDLESVAKDAAKEVGRAFEKLPTDKIESVAKDAAKEVGRAFEKLPTDKIEGVAKDAVKEVGRAFETIGNEIDKALGRTGAPPAPPAEPPPAEPPAAQTYDDGYAPEPPKGPRVG